MRGVTGADVLAAFRRECPRWAPPDARVCARLADEIRGYSGRVSAGRVWNAQVREAHAGNQRLHAALARDLPALAERLLPIVALGEGRDALESLVAAAERFRAAWPEPLGRHPNPPPSWCGLAFTVANMAHSALARANPGRRIGLPRSGNAPLARLLVALLDLGGFLVTSEAVAQYFTRYPYPPPYRVVRPELLHLGGHDL